LTPSAGAARPHPDKLSLSPLWSLTLVIVGIRAGAMVGLWPLVLGSEGVDRSNVLALGVHAAGALATAGFLLARNKAGVLIGLAYTGYSTVALGLNNPSNAMVAMVWVLGALTLAALACALLRADLGHPERPRRAEVLLASVPAVVSAAIVTAVTIALFRP
jgi:hypothetical protein